jgi:KDO2-lipid IV(A) lauroyltransferase
MMKKTMEVKKIISAALARCAYGVAYGVSLLPTGVLYALAAVARTVMYRVIGYRKQVVIQNISRSFPDEKYRWVHGVVKRFYVGFADHMAEMLKSISASPRWMESRLEFTGLEHIAAHVGEGRNVIAAMGHCGNWELLNYMPRKLACDMYAVYKPLRSRATDDLMKRVRARFGMRLIAHKAVARHILGRRSAPAVYMFLADQSPRTRDEKYRFDLLGQPAYHFSGMEKIARSSGAAVVYLDILQTSRGHYRVACLPLCDDAAATDEGEITRRYVEMLTRNIAEDPAGWLWSHKRWKK